MKKKKYEKPAVVYRDKIEARAASCLKASTATAGCTTLLS